MEMWYGAAWKLILFVWLNAGHLEQPALLDSVNQVSILDTMKELGMDENAIQLVNTFYGEVTPKLKEMSDERKKQLNGTNKPIEFLEKF